MANKIEPNDSSFKIGYLLFSTIVESASFRIGIPYLCMNPATLEKAKDAIGRCNKRPQLRDVPDWIFMPGEKGTTRQFNRNRSRVSRPVAGTFVSENYKEVRNSAYGTY